MTAESKVIELELPNGEVALARVTDLGGGGAEKVTGGILKFDFDAVARTLEGLAESIKGAVEKAAPDRVVVELELELAMKNGKLSGLLIEGQGKGSLAVTLEWAGQRSD